MITYKNASDIYGDADTFVAPSPKEKLHPKTYFLWAGIGLIAFLAFKRIKKIKI